MTCKIILNLYQYPHFAIVSNTLRLCSTKLLFVSLNSMSLSN